MGKSQPLTQRLCSPSASIVDFIYSEERWRSEGIQVGGVQAARGVLGYWFDTYVCPSTTLLPAPFFFDWLMPTPSLPHLLITSSFAQLIN